MTIPEAFNQLLDAAQSGDHETVYSLAPDLFEHEVPDVAKLSRRNMAKSLYAERKFAAALAHFHLLVDRFDDPQDRLSQVLCSAMAGEFDEAARCYEATLKALGERAESGPEGEATEVTAPLVAVYYGFALCDGGAPLQAISALDDLFGYYRQLGVTDDHFLMSRGMPPLGQALRLVERLASRYPEKPWSDHLKKWKGSLDDEGQDRVEALLAELE